MDIDKYNIRKGEKMEMKINNMCDWERKKAIFLLNIAENLGMDTSSYGELDVNSNSGYTYLWLEDYNFSLYMPISCELQKTDIYALWTNPEDGEEIEIELEDGTTLKYLEDWASSLGEEVRK